MVMVKPREITNKIILLAIANVLWGFIPWPASYLFETYSLFIVLFTRFFVGGMMLLIITFLLIARINRKIDKPEARINVHLLLDYLMERNGNFRNLPQWLYILIVSVFGFCASIVFFFMGLKLLGAIITSIGFLIGLFSVAIINWGLGKEGMSGFKVLYLITIITCAILLGIGNQLQNGANSSFNLSQISSLSIVITILYGITFAIFLITADQDRLSVKENKFRRKNPKYKTVRTIFKTSLIMIFAAIMLIPLIAIFQFIPSTPEVKMQFTLFFTQLPHWWEILANTNAIVLIFILTVIPFIIYYSLAMVWPKSSAFDMWAGVISILEPIINMIIGITVLEEQFPVSWLVIIIILMFIAIITKFLSETDAQVNAIVLVKLHSLDIKHSMVHAYNIHGVRRVELLLGTWDLSLWVQLPSQKAFIKMIHDDLISALDITNYKILNIVENNLDNSISDSFGIPSSVTDLLKEHKMGGNRHG